MKLRGRSSSCAHVLVGGRRRWLPHLTGSEVLHLVGPCPDDHERSSGSFEDEVAADATYDRENGRLCRVGKGDVRDLEIRRTAQPLAGLAQGIGRVHRAGRPAISQRHAEQKAGDDETRLGAGRAANLLAMGSLHGSRAQDTREGTSRFDDHERAPVHARMNEPGHLRPLRRRPDVPGRRA